MQDTKPIIVVKYGGSSLTSPEHIKRIAQHIIRKKDEGNNVVVVVSAMGKTTDEFIRLAHQVNPDPDAREMDMLISVGERISISLVALAINAVGKYKAVSFTGSQIGLITDTNHMDARIIEIKGDRLREALAQDKIVVVAGFQGVSTTKEITTLGRGGSDTTAVALAAALNATCCEIMSDVDGIYSADPNIIPTAQRIEQIDYDHALEMSAAGAKMLHRVAVELAKRHDVKLSLGNSATAYVGTIVTKTDMSARTVTAVTGDKDVVLIKIDLDHHAGDLAHLLSKNRIFTKTWQQIDRQVIFGIAKSNLSKVQQLLKTMGFSFSTKEENAVLSVIGSGVGIGSRCADEIFRILQKIQCPYHAILSGEIFFKAIVSRDMLDLACQELHWAFFSS